MIKKMEQLICPERQYLEKVFIDFLRREHPTLDLFRKYANDCFAEQNYQVTDRTKDWPRDIRVCLMDNMTLKEIVRLARTSKHWSTIILSPSYDPYWRNRYLKEFFLIPPSAAIPSEITVPETTTQKRPATVSKTLLTATAKRTKKIVKIGWFDIYQYVYSRRTKTNGSLGRRTLRTFLEHKKSIHIYDDSFPDMGIKLRGRDIQHKYKFDLNVFPPWIGSIMPKADQKYSISEICDTILSDIFDNPSKYIVDPRPLVNPYSGNTDNVNNKTWAMHIGTHYPFPSTQVLFKDPLKSLFKHTPQIYGPYASRNTLESYLGQLLTPPQQTIVTALWEALGIRREK